MRSPSEIAAAILTLEGYAEDYVFEGDELSARAVLLAQSALKWASGEEEFGEYLEHGI